MTTIDGEIDSLEVVSHTETPGFTDFLEPPSPFIDQLVRQGEDIDATTGATITAKALVRAFSEVRRRLEEPVWNGATFTASKASDCAPGARVEVIDG